MTRAFLLSSALLGACSVGEVEGPGGDAGVGTADRALCVDVKTPASNAYQHANNGGTRAGLGCMDPGCHGPVGRVGGGEFAYAGTVYKTANGGAPAPGVTVRIFKAGTMNSLSKAVTDSAGNFYVYKTAQFSLSDPQYDTDATACGSTPQAIIPMNAKLTSAGDGNCNKGGCHAVPGTQAIYMP